MAAHETSLPTKRPVVTKEEGEKKVVLTPCSMKNKRWSRSVITSRHD
jgi:hypothetical protein